MLRRFLEAFNRRETSDDAVNPDRVHIATCVLLLEVAYADEDFTEEERTRILDVLKRRFSHSEEQAHELIETADELRRDSHDMWRFTNQLNQNCSPAEKREIIREVWRVVYADGDLDSHEDHLIHRMGTLMNLTHRQLIAEKLAVLEEHQANG
ncbi:MAG: TerB family tellurite resistance protein [FCB group bacterium]|jgi:uncharacterized tellurite resistance protein B-like protein|nr:TerB family tellurite resistance protein [FCB group bacterium]